MAGLPDVNLRTLSLSDAIQAAAVISAVVGTIVTVAVRDTKQTAALAELERRVAQHRTDYESNNYWLWRAVNRLERGER